MSTIPSSASSAAASAAATTAAATAAETAAAQSIISGSTGNSSLDVSSLVTSIVNAKVAGQAAALAARQTSDNTTLTAVGTLQAALSALQAGISSLADGTALSQYTATASGTGLTATGANGATAGSYSIAVTQVATSQALSSPAVNPPTTALGNGTMTISVGNQSMNISITSANNTLSGIASAINSSSNNPGVTATVVTGTSGAHLVLRSTNTGGTNTINVALTNVTNDKGLSSLGVTSTAGNNTTGTTGAMGVSTITSAVAGSPWTQTTPAQDAQFTIDGTAATSASNSVSSAIEGMTLNLTAAAIGTPPGTPQTLTVSQDTSAASTAITSFVSLYNTLVTTYGQVAGFDNSQAAGSQGGALLGDSMLNNIQNTLAGVLSGSVKNGSSSMSLGSIGITLNADGTLTTDATALNTALTSNPSGVAALFNPTTGIAAKMTTSLNSFLSSGGLITSRQDSLNADLKSITVQQATLATYTAQLTNQYQAQFTALNTLMATMNNNSQYLTQLFGGSNSAGALANGKN